MSTLESQSGPAEQLRRGTANPVAMTGITESLATPGVVGSRPLSEGAQAAESLLQSFAALGGASAAIIRQRNAEQAEQDRLDEIDRRHAQEIEVAQRGQANVDAAADMPDLVSRIERGELRPESGESVRDFVARVVDAGDEFSPAYRDQRRARLTDNVSAALQRRLDANRAIAATDNSRLVVESVDGASDPALYDRAVGSLLAVNPNISRTVAESEVGKRWLDSAATLAETDPDGAAVVLAAARSRLGDRMSTEQLAAQARVDAGARDAANLRAQRERAAFYRLANENASTETLRTFISETKHLDGTQLAELYRVADSRERATLAQAQAVSTNALVRDVSLRRWMPDESGEPSPARTVDEIVRRMDIANPDDPNFIDADRGTALLNTIQGAVKFDARADRIRADMGKLLGASAVGVRTGAVASDATVRPATPDDDAALVRTYADAGIVAATGDTRDSMILERINDPTRFAFFSRSFNRVPGDAQALIRAGLSSPDAGQFREGAAAYAALYLQAPHLARSIEMGETEAMRARYIASRVERLGPEVRLDNAALAREVSRLSVDALRMDPELVDYSREQVLGRVYDMDAQAQARPDFTRKVRELAAKDVTSGVFNSSAFKAAGIEQGRNVFGNVRLDSIPDDVLATFARYLDEEFRYARSLTASETAAATAAKAWALDRTLADHPPSTWNGAVLFGRKGEPAVPQEILLDDLATPPNDPRVNLDGWRRMAGDRADDLLANYVPTWDAAQGGYVFRSIADPYALYTEWTAEAVGPLVVDPFAPQEAGAADLVVKIDAAIRARREKKAANRSTTPAIETDAEWARRFGRRRFGGLE